MILPWIALIILPVKASSNANFVYFIIKDRKLGMQLLDSLICNILLIASLSAFLKRFSQIKLASEEDNKKLRWEYGLMVLCSTLRFLLDLGYLVILPLFSTTDCISPIS